jgi:hypothetical protein
MTIVFALLAAISSAVDLMTQHIVSTRRTPGVATRALHPPQPALAAGLGGDRPRAMMARRRRPVPGGA